METKLSAWLGTTKGMWKKSRFDWKKQTNFDILGKTQIRFLAFMFSKQTWEFLSLISQKVKQFFNFTPLVLSIFAWI